MGQVLSPMPSSTGGQPHHLVRLTTTCARDAGPKGWTGASSARVRDSSLLRSSALRQLRETPSTTSPKIMTKAVGPHPLACSPGQRAADEILYASPVSLAAAEVRSPSTMILRGWARPTFEVTPLSTPQFTTSILQVPYYILRDHCVGEPSS
jgi:hypothetical protein